MNNRKFKFLTAAILSAVCCSFYIACGGNDDPTKDNPKPSASISISVANANIDKDKNSEITLDAESLGITVTEGANLSFTVNKTVGAGTDKQTLQITDNKFTVEEGCFYDIIATATLNDAAKSVYVQVREKGLIIGSFEKVQEQIPTIGTGVVQWTKETDESGNSVMKMYRPEIPGSTQGGVTMVFDSILNSNGEEYIETGVIYDVYADISYAKEPTNSDWGIQLDKQFGRENTEWVGCSGRYFIGQGKWDDAGYRNRVQFIARTLENSEFAIDGTNNYCLFDNVVLAEHDASQDPPEIIDIPDAEYETFEVANKNVSLAAGTEFTLSEGTLGFAVPDGYNVNYEVTKVTGAGTDKEVLTVENDKFTVEAGCFYDIKIYAINSQNDVKAGYAQVRDSALCVFGFENNGEYIPTVGTGVVQWVKTEVNGNSVMKMYRPIHPSGNQTGTATVQIDALLDSAELAKTGVKYKVYADISYYILGDEQDWAVQLTAVDPKKGWITQKAGRYYMGEAVVSGDSVKLTMLVRTLFESVAGVQTATAYSIDGENNWMYFDNFVLVAEPA